jgi:hypothetical protein
LIRILNKAGLNSLGCAKSLAETILPFMQSWTRLAAQCRVLVHETALPADADFNQRIIFGLRHREPTIDFQTAHQSDILGRPDPEVLSIDARENRILLSHDRATTPAHFARFTEAQSSPGLIIVSQDADIGAVIEDLLLIWAASTFEELRLKIGFIPL